jgi:large subunit ribosomal protein L5
MADITNTAPRLKTQYQKEIASQITESLKLGNVNRSPKLEKIVINIGIGRAKDDKKWLELATTTLTKITGQKPMLIKARKSIAGFNIRAGQHTIGAKVTLRGKKMYEFLDRLINIAMPRIRDFHGVSAKSFDKKGNYSLGIIEQSIFPELTFEDTTILHGLQITFVINSTGADASRKLLESFGMPFERNQSNNQENN